MPDRIRQRRRQQRVRRSCIFYVVEFGGDDVEAGAFAACFFGDGLAHAVVGEAPACIGQVAWMPVVSRVVEAEYDGCGRKAVHPQQLFLPSSSSESQHNKKSLAIHRKPAARTQAASTRKMREARVKRTHQSMIRCRPRMD
ncbi:hypothetical protein B0H16DRAFT_1452731 [Mycena metata]|uniref:Uncharacterized protein n=1 Tax=Mycena metata TaxID=1033252 RepID=A0AAD7JNT1_9AGAR|nr:hypothetical protein B0H16DRAFT_1452731 [Mycena metata]